MALSKDVHELLQTKLPPAALARLQEIGRKAKDAGMRAFAVGGFVRDLLVCRENLDLDVMIEGDGITFAHQLANEWVAELTIHENFLTAVLKTPDGLRVDIATARRERYPHPAVLPEVKPASAEEDLKRRDFSINAIAVSIIPDSWGQILDPCGGIADLENKVIRILHDQSFVDDPTRIFRAVRFEQRFRFEIEPHTLELLKQARDGGFIGLLSKDRVKHELLKLLQEEVAARHFARLWQLNLLDWIHPSLRRWEVGFQIMARTEKLLLWYRSVHPEAGLSDWVALLMPLVWHIGGQAVKDFCDTYGIGGSEREALLQVAIGPHINIPYEPKPSVLKECWDVLRLEVVIFLLAFLEKEKPEEADVLLRYLLEWRYAKPDITGDDLLATGIPQGPAIAVGLKAALAAKLDEGADKERQLAVAIEAARDVIGGTQG